jgi:PAS domain S-box-containing protein
VQDNKNNNNSNSLTDQVGRTLFSTAPDAIVLVDARGKIALANPQIQQLLGYTPEELVGRPVEDLIPEHSREAHLQHRKNYVRAPSIRPMGSRIWALRQDGQQIPVEVHLSPLQAGQTPLVAAFLRDLRPRLLVEAQARQAHERIQQELTDAIHFVRALLPSPLEVPPMSIHWAFQPSAELGGDALGYHFLPDGRLALYLLDVCGHGISPALLSVAALTSLRSQRLPGIQFTDPSSVLRGLSQAFPSSEHNGMFLSAWYGVLDINSGELCFASAGHPPALLLFQGEVFELEAPGTFLGISDEGSWETIHTSLPAHSTLLVYSDGACELETPSGAMLPFDQFLQQARLSNESPDPSDFMMKFAQQTRQGAPFDDDVSLLSVKRSLPSPSRLPPPASRSGAIL